MKNKNYDVILFNAFRLVSINKQKSDGVFNFDNQLAEAIAMNDALISQFGIKTSPAGLIKLAQNNASEEVYDFFKNQVFANEDKYKNAKAMYTPGEARNIDTATFRFHQMLNYFSVYGLEELLGTEVSRGWMPAEAGVAEELDPVEEDIALIEAKVFEVIFEDEKYLKGYKSVASKRNRATALELAVLEEAVKNLTKDEILATPVVFKENLIPIFNVLVDNFSDEERIDLISSVCQNSGDVLKCLKNFLNKNKWKLTTSQKRMMVRILEKYSVNNFSENLMLSNKKREENLLLLKYIDFNTYSRSSEHKKVVADLRDGSLKSWEGKLKKALSEGDTKKALEIAKQRSGMLIRYSNFLIKNGVKADDIFDALKQKANRISLQTLVENINIFSLRNIKSNLVDNKEDLLKITKSMIKEVLKTKETLIKNKKVFVDPGMFDLEHSSLEFNSKSSNSDYISSGLAVKLPTENVDCLRMFVYWEDSKTKRNKRVDIDSHFFGFKKDGSPIHIGWNSSHRDGGIVFSGDVTTSNPYGCEFIDIDLNDNDIDSLVMSFHSYTGQTFDEINNLKVGILPISKLGLEAKKSLYNTKNCIFSHEINNKTLRSMGYGFLNITDGYIKFIGKSSEFTFGYTMADYPQDKFISHYTVSEYLNTLLEAQNAELVDKVEDADIILKLTKPEKENEVSLIDENWFAD